ncbi:ELMO domain-containing protein 1-like isoform X5 [Sinocyclocheilus grahami]|uniref:ELMO domain-containing protein 1-like isoform X5 n=1 Tax=Sinocyclocheilus grahami TaxID=75366 RepID=UPI0007AC83BF|nr:PREDICTED: ELMO domain-containing protein 1-like isoform X5 [Sinocyclocheilus grahami]
MPMGRRVYPVSSNSQHNQQPDSNRVLTQLLVLLYCKCLWRGLKFVIRKVTGRCELQWICYNNKPGARRTLKIESSLKCSKHELLQSAISVHPDSVEKTIDDIMSLKKINLDTNPQLGISLQACLLQIVGYRNLVVEVEKLRREPYDCENPAHEEMLVKLWKELRPDSPLSGRISKQWCEIGFQGNDPKTDFRGMGLLGLHNLLYFAEHDKATALQVLHDSLQPKHSMHVTIMHLHIPFFLFLLLFYSHHCHAQERSQRGSQALCSIITLQDERS